MLAQIITENGQKKVIPLTADAGAGLPVGTIIAMYKKSNPSGFLYLDGRDTTGTSEELSTHYPLLYAYLGSNVLPDYREFALVGAEENTTDVYNASTNPNGTIHDHDVYTEGQAKDDQVQDHEHKLYYPAISADVGLEGNTVAQGTNQGLWTWGTNNSVRAKNITVGRHGTVTRGKRKAVYFYIKATSGLSENAQDNVINTLNEQRSYSTEEHLTGRKWIDGKDIYSNTVYVASTSETAIDITSLNIDTPIKVDNAVAYKYNGVTNKHALPQGVTSGGISFQATKLLVVKGAASYNYQDIYITLEYTKTT